MNGRPNAAPDKPLWRYLVEGVGVAVVLAFGATLIIQDPRLEAEPPDEAAASAEGLRATARDDRPFAQRRPAPEADPGGDTGRDPRMSDWVQQFAAEHGGLVCRLDQPLDFAEAVLQVDGASFAGMVFGDEVLFADGLGSLGEGPAEGRARIGSYSELPITWSRQADGSLRCDGEPLALLEPDQGIVGYVENAAGLPEGRVWVTGCGERVATDEDGAFFLPAAPGTCTVQGFRQDGWWQSRTERVEVELRDGEDVELDLVLPDRPRGGIGAGVQRVADGVLLWQIHDGGSAWAAGLEEGTVVTAVEGEAVQRWSLAEFVDAVTGPEGTDVQITVRDPDGGEEVVVLDRRAMGPQG